MNFKKLTEYLDYLPIWRIPGTDCSLYHKGKEVYRHQSGFSDVESKTPMTPDRTFFMYSCTKVMTCTAALMLLEKGAYLLNDPVSEYIPEFKNMTYINSNINVPVTNSMLIKHLFSMTAGFSYNISTAQIKKYKQETNGRFPTQTIIKALSETPLLFEPGTHYNYSLCHDVLGALIERLSGRTLGKFMKENIWDKCNMNDTSFALTPELESRMASQYQFVDEKGKYLNLGPKCEFKLGTEYESGGAGLISTVDDYIKFIEALRKGELLSIKTVDLMRTNQLNTVALNEYHSSFSHQGYVYGLGVRCHADKASSGVISSYSEFGWDGAAGSLVVIDPEAELSFFYAQHMRNGQQHIVQPRLKNIIYSCIF